MLLEKSQKIFIDLIEKSSIEEIIWMYGYIYGMLYNSNKLIYKKNKNYKDLPITIVYGTVTGNAKELALCIYKKLIILYKNIKLINLEKYKNHQLYNEKYLLIIISTHGDGDPPKTATNFFNFIHEKRLNNLKNLKYSVLALGDKSYSQFCKAGYDIDKRLKEIGGSRIVNFHRCDVYYKKDSNKWFVKILDFFKKININSDNKLCGKILKNIILNKKSKDKNRKIHHIEISIQNSIKYFPGDSIGVYPTNSSEEVNDILNILKINKNDEIFYILKKEKNIFNLSKNFLEEYIFLYKKLEKNKDIFIDLKKKWSLIDIVNKIPIKLDKYSLKKLFSKLDEIKPRLYSISSSYKVHFNVIHITVALNYFNINGKIKYGYCSNFLSNLKIGDKLSFFIYKNNSFRLPKNKSKNIILIGTGTGIAPFRSFLYEREYYKSSGKNWLFFGNQYEYIDFLYNEEIKNWEIKGIINKVSLAFSRDQNKKIYIQDIIWENRIEFFYWIKNGAYVYICGKKDTMSIDIDNIILKIIENVGKEKYPLLFIDNMKKNSRYLKDVY